MLPSYNVDAFQRLEIPMDGVAVVPNDDNDLPITGVLYVAVSGNLNVNMASGANVMFYNVPVGIHQVCVSRVLATGTTAGNIVVLG